MSVEDIPEFPPKKLFNLGKGFVEKRINKINRYFDNLFSKFCEKVPYTNAVIDLCQPFKLNVAVIGMQGTGKSSLIQGIIDLLVESKN